MATVPPAPFKAYQLDDDVNHSQNFFTTVGGLESSSGYQRGHWSIDTTSSFRCDSLGGHSITVGSQVEMLLWYKSKRLWRS